MILRKRLNKVIDAIDAFLQPNNDMAQIKYPAATVLLDLTANEDCIEQVAELV